MPGPPLYLDECVDYGLAEALRKRGFTVHTALGSAMTELSDEKQLAYAAEWGWMILTHNARGFRRLHRVARERGEEHGGIAILPARPPLEIAGAAGRDAARLDRDVRHPSVRLVHVGPLQRLLEGGYRPPGYPESEVRYALSQAAM